jgi:hypothetical protein
MPHKKGRYSYKGYQQPPAGGHSEAEQHILRVVYGKCRAERYPGESQENKSRCAKIAWSVVKKSKG